MDTLNWLSGCGFNSFSPVPPDALQHEVLRHVEGLANAMEPTKEGPSPQECFRTLLRGRGLYDDPGHVNLAPYQSDAVSLPSQLRDAPPCSRT